MSNSEPTVVTAVNVQGVAIADYDLANFRLVIAETGETKESVQKALRERVDELDSVLASLEESGVSINKDRLTRSTNVEQDYKQVKRKWVPSGYRATFTLAFQTSSVDKASLIYDRLAHIEMAAVSPPDFKINDLTALHDAARKDAFAKAMEQFRAECAVVGVNPDDYRIHTWNFHYNNRHSGGARPMGGRVAMAASATMEFAGGSVDPVEIVAGKAEVYATVNLSFVERQIIVR